MYKYATMPRPLNSQATDLATVHGIYIQTNVQQLKHRTYQNNNAIFKYFLTCKKEPFFPRCSCNLPEMQMKGKVSFWIAVKH